MLRGEDAHALTHPPCYHPVHSGLGVGDDPSGFDVGEDNWTWSPRSPEIRSSSGKKRDNGGTTPSHAATPAAESVGSLSSRFSACFSGQSGMTRGGHEVAGGAIVHGAGLRVPGYSQGQGARREVGRDGMRGRRNSSWVMALEVSW